MSIFHPTPAVTGFQPPPADLPAERADVALQRRRHGALVVLAIGRGHTPEDVVDGFPADVLDAFADELELREAIDWIDQLLEALVPRDEAGA